MADIVSRIKLEAAGADQAAREILKLKEAYEQTGKAAREISPTGGGSSDPFARAVSSGGGSPEAAQSAAQREQRNALYRQQSKNRQEENDKFTGGGQVTGALGAANSSIQQAAQGGFMGAAGSALGGVASFLGPAGLGLAAGAIAMKGMESLGGNAMERVDRYWGSGVAQRLDSSFRETEGFAIGAGRTGIPAEMVNSVIQSASQSGFSARGAGANNAAQFAVEAAGMLGVNPGVMGQILGATSRAGVDGNFFGNDLMGTAKGTFGAQNVGTFMTELSRTLEEAMQRGVSMTGDQLDNTVKTLGGYVQLGGMSTTAAVAMNQTMMGRGAQAGRLQKPEDIIAFQAMSAANPGMSMTNVMQMMEQDPSAVNRSIYDYLQDTTGGDEDLLRLRMQSYTGMSMSQVIGLTDTYAAEDTMTPKQREKRFGSLKYSPWRNRGQDAEGNWGNTSEERNIYAMKQQIVFKGLEDAILNLQTGFADMFLDANMDIRNARFERAVFAPGSFEAVGLDTVTNIKNDPNMLGTLTDLFEIGAQYSASPTTSAEFQRIIRDGGKGADGTTGGWGSVTNDIFLGIQAAGRGQLGKGYDKAVGSDIADMLIAFAGNSMQLNDKTITSSEEMMLLLKTMVDILTNAGVVFTDGSDGNGN